MKTGEQMMRSIILVLCALLFSHNLFASEIAPQQTNVSVSGQSARDIVAILKFAGVAPKIENRKETYVTDIDCYEHRPDAGVEPEDLAKYQRVFVCNEPNIQDQSKAKRLLEILGNIDMPEDSAMGGRSGVSNIKVTCAVTSLATECFITQHTN
ncbi:MAG: hypothetical protein ACD_66C00251G0002 [uncultured bacterium]|nr:MAG: hypothetical protein ACD_66C00251G0002 [uncultured bacterium]